MKKSRDQIRENRLWNMRQLVRSCGGVNAAARILKRDNSYVTAIAGPNPTRSIGDRAATTIETAFGLPSGALDFNPPEETKREDPLIAQICATLANAPDADKEFVLHMSEWIVKRRISSKNGNGTVEISAADVR